MTSRRGSVLVIVLWICLGLVALTLYFANSMSSELRASDNRVLQGAAHQAVAGGMRYATYVLKQYATNGTVPDLTSYQSQALPVGDASFWFIGRDPNNPPTTDPYFCLVDENSKINLNTASFTLLSGLPGMTPDLANAIIAWRTAASDSSGNSSGSTYSLADPPRRNKGAPFESVDELRLVYGATLALLLGEDTNRNGVLDSNENDGSKTAPIDNQDGQLQPGIWEYVTVWSSQPNTRASGAALTNIATPAGRQALAALLTRELSAGRSAQIMTNLGSAPITSLAQFMVVGQLTSTEYTQVRGSLTTSAATTVQGLINVNTASATVLACIPGIGTDNASAIVAYRLAHPDQLTSFAWLPSVLSRANIVQAGPFITDRSYQFSADIAAAGKNARGYAREKFIFDMSKSTPRIIYHQDLSAYGWALGSQARQTLKTGNRSL